jgi:hypothetical protein
MAFQKQLLPTCPSCNNPGLRVIETRPTPESIRRRKRCDVCGYRITTHEISQEVFQASKDDAIALQRVRSALGVGERTSVIACLTCKFNQGDCCAFDLPEYGTEDAFDCNLAK